MTDTSDANKERNREIARNEEAKQVTGSIRVSTWAVAVVVIIGGILFTLSELACAVEARLPVVVLLWNNQGYGEIKKYMLRHDVATIGVDLVTPDFVAIARGFGCAAERVASPGELVAALERHRGREVPSVIEIDEATWFAATVSSS